MTSQDTAPVWPCIIGGVGLIGIGLGVAWIWRPFNPAAAESCSSAAKLNISPNTAGPVTTLLLVRHADRQDYANPGADGKRDGPGGWRDQMRGCGMERYLHNPPISALGKQQSRETADFIRQNFPLISQIYASPYYRVVQTCMPLAESLDLKVCIELGLAETNHKFSNVRTEADMFSLFPLVDMKYKSLHVFDENITESFPEGYMRRMRAFAPVLEKAIEGRTVVCFSHAASVALVAALLKKSVAEVGKFHPCGIFHLRKPGQDRQWELISSGLNASYLSETHPGTKAWGFNGCACQVWDRLEN